VRIILDTNIFNSVLDGTCKPDLFLKHEVFVTHIQKDELQATPDPHRRADLLATFANISSVSVPTKTAVWDDTPWDGSEWSAEGGLYERILARITSLDSTAGKRKALINQSRDARIAEVAVANRIILVTNDRSLATATTEHGGQALTLPEFQKL
jgi:hypothetical protein